MGRQFIVMMGNLLSQRIVCYLEVQYVLILRHRGRQFIVIKDMLLSQRTVYFSFKSQETIGEEEEDGHDKIRYTVEEYKKVFQRIEQSEFKCKEWRKRANRDYNKMMELCHGEKERTLKIRNLIQYCLVKVSMLMGLMRS